MTAAKVQLTATQEAELRRLHAEGTSRNQCAKHFGIASATMTRIANELGLVWDTRPELSAAVEQRTLDLRLRRARAAEDAMSEAETLIDRIGRPALIRQLGSGGEGRPSLWLETTLPRPDARAVKDLASAASTLALLSMKLVEFDKGKGTDTEEAIGRLTELSGDLAGIAQQLGAEVPAPAL